MSRQERKNLIRLARNFVQGVGEDEKKAFVPSPFQIEAIHQLKERDVLVVAPTGSGKTYIAEQAIAWHLKRNKTSWYTTPLKALSNQKYDAFRNQFGDEKVGIITGERKENQHAPIIVATTEVLRNLLYTKEPKPDLAILDEIHFISDQDRGVTWEEVLILAPNSMRLLMLSATVSNPEDITMWLQGLGRSKLAIIREKERPVPLKFGLLSRSYHPVPMKKAFVLHRKKIKTFIDPVRLHERLSSYDLLPAIVFMSRRADCDRQAAKFRQVIAEGKEKRKAFVDSFLTEHPYIRKHPFLPTLVSAGVAPHHAGHITAWKLCVERMLKLNLLQIVFATTTLAAGLDVPARTVVLPSLQTRTSRRSRYLSSTEFHQMTGRAGRRGVDRLGFVLMQARDKKDFERIAKVVRSPAEPLTSSFKVTYYQILNLLHQLSEQESFLFLEKSLAVFQKAKESRHGAPKVARRLKAEFSKRVQFLKQKGYLDPSGRLTPLGEMAKEIRQERCLFIVESIKAGSWNGLTKEEVAGAAAMFTTERSPRTLIGQFPIKSFLHSIRALEREQKMRKIDEPFSADKKFGFKDAEKKAVCVKRFAEGLDFEELIHYTESEEGDLQRLILQTYELLQELEKIPDPLAEKAREVKPMLYRYPVG